eukprot:scaffold212_cov108-Skeletonema_dohrnii-CCMP3373.AAC.16
MLVNELVEFCKSESLSEDGLCEIIERYGLTPGDINNTLSNYEFFFWACRNKRVNERIIRCLIKYFPTAASATDEYGKTPLHVACNRTMPRGIIQLLIDAAPDSVCSVSNDLGYMPLHILCGGDKMDKTEAVEILKLFIEKYPEAVRHADNKGELPIHIAAQGRSPEFCRVLIEAYPGSERIASDDDEFPLHNACRFNTFAIVKYLYNLYPDAVNHASTSGFYPIHYAITCLSESDNPAAAMEIVHFLLDCDPNVKFQKFDGKPLLHYAYMWIDDYLNIDDALEVIKAIYDANPEAIEDNNITSDIQEYHQRVQSFIRSELVYAHQAKDRSLMTTPDENGYLPLHTALQNSVRLGSIKLLVKGNPSALRTVDNNFAMPLHIACHHHNSASVVQYLLDLDRRTLRAIDIDNDTALHYACRGAKYDTIALLLENYDATFVSKRNAQKKLPIDLLWESNAVGDRESVDYTASVFRLLKSYPETVLITMMR